MSGGVSGSDLVLVGLCVFLPVRITTFSWVGGGEPSCIPKSHIHSPWSSSGFLLHLSLVTQQLWTVADVDDAFLAAPCPGPGSVPWEALTLPICPSLPGLASSSCSFDALTSLVSSSHKKPQLRVSLTVKKLSPFWVEMSEAWAF